MFALFTGTLRLLSIPEWWGRSTLRSDYRDVVHEFGREDASRLSFYYRSPLDGGNGSLSATFTNTKGKTVDCDNVKSPEDIKRIASSWSSN